MVIRTPSVPVDCHGQMLNFAEVKPMNELFKIQARPNKKDVSKEVHKYASRPIIEGEGSELRVARRSEHEVRVFCAHEPSGLLAY